MPRFFTTQITDTTAVIEGEDARHISKSLRMRQGEELTVCDGSGYDYHGVIDGCDEEQVVIRIHRSEPSKGESVIGVTLYQAMPKGDKLDTIVQKAVELGAVEIVPVLTEFCVSRPKPEAFEKKRQRLNRIALEAAKQSGRGIIPQVAKLITFTETIKRMGKPQKGIMFYENTEQPLHSLLEEAGLESLGVFIGSEGGFSPKEVAQAQEQGIAVASLGRRILRCETASACALSAISYAFKEF